ncbi:MAG: ECF transporter S component, partial [Erysipelotrichaceae bacterium]
MKIRQIVISGLLLALVFVVTTYVALPVSNIGYINLGDTMVISSGLLLVNPFIAFVVGGVGSMLADLAAGYSQYALFTLVIKGCEALIVCLVFNRLKGKEYWSIVLGGIIVAFAYPFVDVVL